MKVGDRLGSSGVITHIPQPMVHHCEPPGRPDIPEGTHWTCDCGRELTREWQRSGSLSHWIWAPA